MCFRSPEWRLASVLLVLSVLMPSVGLGREIRVCADPNNLPFSNEAGEGFENRIMQIIADELGDDLTFIWWAQRRGYIGNALDAGLCDLVPGVSRIDGVLLTYPPYYRSTYVVVTRQGGPDISSLDDPRLRELRVGVQLVGDDGANTPPAHALARRGIVENVRGYTIVGDYRQPNPPSRIIEAVAEGEIDLAMAWGPMAGYFAAQSEPPLQVRPLAEQADYSAMPLAFDIFMGVRLDEGALRQEIEGAMNRRRTEIDAVLAEYHVPRLDDPAMHGGALQ